MHQLSTMIAFGPVDSGNVPERPADVITGTGCPVTSWDGLEDARTLR
ncbi:hypothetical protein [Streptosporangium lutulentum]|uniref:Uncharacterized protein n=1 Tax=Streptosporangium lutulentum TaxID=1461250 RepID=A0ABT9QNY7_9ACTN|nr:hypothetical protein [Streptosporangium lutulentum]MDP9848076.1 hypothetical protein [Streptosporangium lutulentum]